MAFIDQISFTATAGRGGDGVVRWRREKYEPKGGPYGGNGGKGGDFYIEGVRNIMILTRISHIAKYQAENGGAGGTARRHGADADDFILKLPVGSVITDTETGVKYELLHEGQRILILKGGRGGMGNDHFKSSTNVAPEEATPGELGEQGLFTVELRLIADAGFVGFPNAGKTSLLNVLTNAAAKVGDYPFTTLSPNLGAMDGYILADIPGIIEDASEGKGLGLEFLRHISRTRVIIHCISAERDDIISSYKSIRKELEAYGEGIASKKELVVITKSDEKLGSVGQQMIELAQYSNAEMVEVSIYDDASIRTLRTKIGHILARQ